MKKVLNSAPWLLFVWVIFQNLSLNFVEGDDASTVLYHVLGRNPALQKPYSAYHSFFDFILSVIPAVQVNLIISTALALSVFGGLLTYWGLERITDKGAHFFLFALLLAQPEWLFMVLYINPAILAMGLFVMAFFLLQRHQLKPRKKILLLASILFGLAIAVRWSFVLGFFTFLPFLLVDKNYQINRVWWHLRNIIGHATFWFFPISLFFAFSFVIISGYSLKEFFEILVWGKNYITDYKISLKVAISDLSGYLSLATVLMITTGFLMAFKTKNWWTILVVVFSLLPFFVLGFDTSFKYNLTLMPALVLIMYLGWQSVMQQNFYKRLAFIFLLILPWFLGIQVDNQNIAWGPGLELQYKKPSQEQLQEVKFGLQAGLAMPNAEGVRPLWGYADALVWGAWKKFIVERAEERHALALQSLHQNCILFMDRPVALIQMAFVQNGFELKPAVLNSSSNCWNRTMKHSSLGFETILVTPGDFEGIDAFSNMITKQRKSKNYCTMAYLSFPSLMTDLVAHQPDFFPLSATTGIW